MTRRLISLRCLQRSVNRHPTAPALSGLQCSTHCSMAVASEKTSNSNRLSLRSRTRSEQIHCSLPLKRCSLLCDGGQPAICRILAAHSNEGVTVSAAESKRVQFDFEIEFLNGGGIQGQGFRLDIDGDDIADEALARYIVKDLRLLMVGTVRILNKAIIAEPHKRSGTQPSSVASDDVATIIDLSHTIEDGMITYKGLPAPII